MCSARAVAAAADETEERRTPAPSAAPTADEGAEAQPPTTNKRQCIEAHKQTQAFGSAGRLVEAREQAQKCTDPGCPGLLVADCARWLSDLEQRIPSVVFEVRADGRPNVSAHVFVDDRPIDDWTSGRALRLDPGQHTFRFELAGRPSVTETVVVAEGMRFRVVSAEFAAPPPPSVDRGTVRARPVPLVVYPLLGVGALGVGGFAAFALLGKSEQQRLERTCSPRCTDSDLASMRARFLVGDISLGVGIAALVGAGVVYLSRPERPVRASVGFAPLLGGGIASLTMPSF
jgi:hypothetical protein